MKRKNPFDNISNNNKEEYNNFYNSKSFLSNNFPTNNNFNNNFSLGLPKKNSEFIEDAGFEIIKHEYNTRIKPLNCTSNYISTTSEILPSDEQTLSQLGFPIGISISPLNNSFPDDVIPVIDYGSNNIPRCKNQNCCAYLNPFVKFIENGEKWICNFCGEDNDTEDHYFCDLDKNGERLDANSKPELCYGSYEFKTNKSYWKKNKTPTKAFFIFLIETSLNAIDTGFFSACVESIKEVINNELFYNGNKTNISIITYSTNVSFFAYGEKFTQPQMLTVADEPVFLPTSKNNLILNMNDEKEKILQIIDFIQNTFNRNNSNIINNNTKDSEKLFSALNGAYLLGKNLGGKIIIFSSSNILSNLSKMNGGLDKNTTKEQIAYSCHDNKQIETMGINLTNENMSVDLFVSAEKNIKLLTLFQLCEYTNGNLYFYKKFNIDLHYKNIFNQIIRELSKPICWEGLNRTRFSNGLTISNYLTPVLIFNNDLFVFPTGDSDQNYFFNVGYSNKKNEDNSDKNKNKNLFDFNREAKTKPNYIYIQSALLYSYGDGKRRIRVHNLCLPLSSNPRIIYESMNSNNIATYFLKLTCDKLYKSKNLANSVLYTDNQFKSFIDKVLGAQNKIKNELPENLENLPLYMIGLFKHRLFCKDEVDKNYDIDISNFLRTKLLKLSAKEIIPFIYPNIYYLNDLEMDQNIGKFNEETGLFTFPEIVSCSKNSIKENGLYLIDNGYLLIIYVRKKVNKNIIKNLFGVDDLNSLNMVINENNVFSEKNEFKEQLMNIIDYIREGKSVFPNLIFVFEGAGGEKIINDSLIEDNNCQWFPLSYEKFYQKYIQESSNFPY